MSTSDDGRNELAIAIRDARIAKGLTQQQLADDMTERGVVGWHQQTVARVEAGRRAVRPGRESDALEAILGVEGPKSIADEHFRDVFRRQVNQNLPSPSEISADTLDDSTTDREVLAKVVQHLDNHDERIHRMLVVLNRMREDSRALSQSLKQRLQDSDTNDIDNEPPARS